MSGPDKLEVDRLKGLLKRGDEAGALLLAAKLARKYPGSAVAWNAWGGLLGQTRQYSKALKALQRAAILAPDDAAVQNNLGNIYVEVGQPAKAVETYRKALHLQPNYPACSSNLLFSLQYAPAEDPDADLRLARHFGACAEANAEPYRTWRCNESIEPLRVGWVSGDLREHPVGYFLEGVFAKLDPRTIEMIAYPTNLLQDGLTERLRRHCTKWFPIDGLADREAASHIHRDGIHVLVDLSGHTAQNRLTLFAWRPAPVQVSWLGYVATTGLSTIDYLVADPVSVPPGAETAFVETVLRMPDTRFCFSPPQSAIAVSELPARSNGYVTFGSYSRLSKLHDTTLELWKQVLVRVEGSRLRIMARELSDAELMTDLRRRLARIGMDLHRVDLHRPLPREGYLAAYGDVDIMLDTFPFTGGTTTAEALWMGVPVMTLAGRRLVERQAASLMTAVGLSEWIARDPDDYLHRACKLAGDLDELARLRAGLRRRMLQSPVCDPARFAANLEQAFLAIWRQSRR